MVGEGGWDLLLIREEQTEDFWGIGKYSQTRSGSRFYQCPLCNYLFVCIYGIWTFLYIISQ